MRVFHVDVKDDGVITFFSVIQSSLIILRDCRYFKIYRRLMLKNNYIISARQTEDIYATMTRHE